MKTSPTTTNTQCEEQRSYLSVYASLLLALLSVINYKIKSRYRALLDGLDGRTASISLSLMVVLKNRRHLVGVVLMILAPLSASFYHLLDSTPPPQGSTTWYFLNWHYYFFAVSNYLFILFSSFSAFLLFPTKYKISYFAAVVPVFYAILRIIHLSFFVNTYSEYYNHNWISILSACMISVSILLAGDYLVYRKFHIIDGALRRIMGWARTPGIPAEKKVEVMEQLSYEWENLNAKV